MAQNSFQPRFRRNYKEFTKTTIRMITSPNINIVWSKTPVKKVLEAQTEKKVKFFLEKKKLDWQFRRST